MECLPFRHAMKPIKLIQNDGVRKKNALPIREISNKSVKIILSEHLPVILCTPYAI